MPCGVLQQAAFQKRPPLGINNSQQFGWPTVGFFGAKKWRTFRAFQANCRACKWMNVSTEITKDNTVVFTYTRSCISVVFYCYCHITIRDRIEYQVVTPTLEPLHLKRREIDSPIKAPNGSTFSWVSCRQWRGQLGIHEMPISQISQQKNTGTVGTSQILATLRSVTVPASSLHTKSGCNLQLLFCDDSVLSCLWRWILVVWRQSDDRIWVWVAQHQCHTPYR